MTREERLLQAIAPSLQSEITQLKRKLKKAIEQRDEWKHRATEYRKRLLEKS